jgi:hypothetical protein
MAAHCSNCSFCDTSKAQVLHEWEEKPELYGIRKYSIPSVIFLLTLTSHHSHFLCAMDLSFIFVLLSHILWNIFFESCTRSGGSVVHQHWMFYELWWDKMILASWLYKQKSSYCWVTVGTPKEVSFMVFVNICAVGEGSSSSSVPRKTNPDRQTLGLFQCLIVVKPRTQN